MKKIILIIIILLLTGCYDYNELTDLGIVSSMVIDYKENEFEINLEILETKENVDKTSFFLSSKGKTFESALNNFYKKTPKHLYFNHMYAVVISDNVIDNKLGEIYDYFLIDADVRKDSYFVGTDDVEKILKFETEDKLSIGETIKSVIEFNEKENGQFRTSRYRDILHSNLNNCTYPIGKIIIDDNVLSIKDVNIINDNKLLKSIDGDKVLFLNMLNNEPLKFIIETQKDTYKIYKYKLSKNINKDKIQITLNVDARLFGNSNSNSFTKDELLKLENEISEKLKIKIVEDIEYSKKENIDIYNFNHMYYKYYPNDVKNSTFKNLNYEIKVNTTLNEKGLLLIGVSDNKNE